MIRKFTFLFLTVFAMLSARAGFTPVTVTGFNKDVVANGTGPVRSSAVSVDDKRDTIGYSFNTQDYRSPASAAPTYYLPQNGLISSAVTSGLTYQLASYSGNNSLRLDTTGSTGSLAFQTSVNASDIYFLATAGGAGAVTSDANVVITFSDNTTATATLSVRDWYNYTPVVIQGIGRVSMTDGGIDNGSGATNPRLYEYKITLAAGNWSKTIQSISFTRTNATGLLHIMAVSVNTVSSCGPPTNAPTNLVLTPTVYGVTGSFTASVPAANKYLVLRAIGANGPDTPPTDGQTYTAGQTLGNATIISASASTTFSDPGLVIGSTYTYFVIGYSDSTCYGISPAYNAVNYLFGSTTIPSCAATPGGTYSVGPTGTYPTLTAAMTVLNNAAGASGNIIIELQSTYTSTSETFPIVIPNISSSPCAVGNPTLIIRPALGATNVVITGKVAAPILDFNNARRVTLDGRPGGVGTTRQLTIINDSTAGVAIRLTNDASYNNITYCDIQGRNSSATSGTGLSGVVYFGQANTTTLGGNDYNAISYSNIHGTTSGTPAIGISAYGTTPRKAAFNDSCTISNCNIYDFFNVGVASTGIKLDVGNNAWAINANSIYQTAPRTPTTGVAYRGIWVTPNVATNDSTAGGFTITNNYIGGTAANAGGIAYTMNGAATYVFDGMDISVGSGVATSIQSNTIANLSLTSASGSTTGVFIGINIANGNLNIGNLVPNTIGSATTAGSINVVSASAGTSFGIRVANATVANVANNIISGITGSGTTTAISTNFTGIGVAGGNAVNVTGNTIGSLTLANSINLTSVGATAIAQSINGVNVTGGTITTVVNNTIANLTNAYTGTGAGVTRGISVSTSATTINGNLIRNLSNATLSTSGGATSALIGIAMTSANTTGSNVSGNTIHSLISTSTSASVAINFTGIFYSGTSSAVSTISKNFIHSFETATADTNVTMTGVDFATATATVANNYIRLGVKVDGSSYNTASIVRGISSNSSSVTNNFYYNTIYIGGTGVGTIVKPTYAFIRTSASGTYDVKNNIFINTRSNSSTGGKHYAVYFTTATTGASLNNNVYLANGTGGVFANNGTADVTTYTGTWLTGDVSSAYGSPGLINPNGTSANLNLHIAANTSSIAESAGTPVALITDDYDGDNRSATTPDAGADEFVGTNPNICAGTPVAGVVIASNTQVCTGVVVTLSDTTYSTTAGISFQWQSSTDSTNWQTIPGANTNSYTATIFAKTYYRLVVTCGNSSTSATTAGLAINIFAPTYAVYNGTQYTESFENWASTCSTTDIPTTNWKTAPSTGNNSWRRNDQQASAGWVNPTLGTYTPASTVGTYSARFHSYQAALSSQGMMDFYVNMSAAAASTNLKFDYINTSGTDSLSILISTNGGNTFTRLDSVGLRSAWANKTILLTTNSATTVIRFLATSDFGNTDIGVDNMQLVNFAACAGTPTAGTVFSSVIPACPGVGFTLSDTSAAQLSGVTYQWQSSSDSTTWNTITGATTTSYTTSITTPTYYRLAVTCTNSAAVAYTAGLRINLFAPTYAIYNGTSYAESFENWLSTCNTTDLPSINWRTSPSSGDNSWRRNDQGTNANWTNAASGAYTPVSTVGSYSARFHTYNAAVGSQGTMDFFVNMSAAGPSTNLKFDYINTSGTDSLAVFVSTNGGTTFTRVDSVGVRAAWSTKTINLTSTSPTTVIRLQGYATAQFGTDIGIDNLQLVNFAPCAGTPVAGLVYSSANPICSGVSFILSDTTASQLAGITYQWQSSSDSATWAPITNATTTSYTTSITATTYYRLAVTCANGGAVAYTAGLKINLNLPTNCYCTPTYTNGGTTDNVTSVVLGTLSQTTVSNVTPYYYNYTATQNAIPNLARSASATLTLTFGTDGNQYNGVWIDFDKDGTFATTEYFTSGTNAGASGTATITISVPSTAVLGVTRMRIRGGDDSQPTSAQACGASSSIWGQAQDYFVNITNGTVPITLLSFSGEHKQDRNQLTWTTASEQNNKGFELQRSADGTNFSALTFVASKGANGNSTTNLTYSFADVKTFAGNNYYRLKQIDNDGKVAYSNTVLLKGDKVNALTLSMVYPNPAKDKLNVIIASPKADKLTLIVSDVTGKIVRQQKVNAVTGDNNFEVNVQSLTAGNYIIKAICNDGCETVISRFVKQ